MPVTRRRRLALPVFSLLAALAAALVLYVGYQRALARRPYDLRHAALSLWLNASGAPAEVAARAGTSARVLHEVYLHCTDGQATP